MQKLLNTIFKLHLVLAIFIGLQGRVLVRYANAFMHKGNNSELSFTKASEVRTTIVHCKLQCFAQKFQQVILPFVAFHSDIPVPTPVVLLYHSVVTTRCQPGYKLRQLPLRAPPFSEQV